MTEKICYNCFHEKTQDGVCPVCGYSAEQDKDKYPLALPHGTILNGKYILGRVLGQGGFGITYVAQDWKTKKRVAVKEYLPDTMATRIEGHTVSAYSGQREESFIYGKECFLSEAKTLAEFIGNENIVRIHSYFEENGTAYFVMEYVDGVSFQTYIQDQGGKIDWQDAGRILFPIMDALGAVHAKGIIHRDVTPDNIFITEEGTVKLLDFGAARYSLGDKSRSLDVVLKHGYAPKEQYTRRGRQGAYTDVYSVAACFYFAVTGRKPPDSIERMDEDDLIPPSSLGVKVSEEQEDALLKGLNVQAADRYQNMADFKAAMTAGEEPQTVAADAPAGSSVLTVESRTAKQHSESTGMQKGSEAVAHPAVAECQHEMKTVVDYRSDEPHPQISAKFKFDLHNKKFRAMLIGGVCSLVAISIVAIVVVTAIPRHVEAMSYEYSALVGSQSQKYSGTYTGDWKNRMPYRQGTMTYANGDKYEGEWKDGMKNGQGIMTWKNGSVYEGEWKDDARSGQGTYTYAEGRAFEIRDYEGEWKDGMKNGQGIMTWKDGSVYEGEWKDDARSGQGTYTYAGKYVYEGEWKDGMKNGQGVMTWNNGDVYEGEWKDGKYNGQGTMTYASGDKYRGQWKDDERSGQGAMTYAQNEYGVCAYVGEWKGNRRNGQGIMTWNDGAVYEGEWKGDARSGQGTLILADGDRYEGEWKDGKYNGQGTMTYVNGDKYEGEWKDGKYNGQGTMTYVNGDKYEGEWKDNKRNGQGTYTWVDGDIYEGEWKDGNKNGQGTYTFPSGNVKKGKWKDGKFVG